MEADRFKSSSFSHNLAILDVIDDNSVLDIAKNWSAFCDLTDALVKRRVDLSAGSELASLVISLCKHGLQSLVQDHFLHVLEEMFENGAQKFWRHFEAYSTIPTVKWKKLPELHLGLSKALEELSAEKLYEEKCLLIIVCAIQSYIGGRQVVEERCYFSNKYRLMISSVLQTNFPSHFQDILHHYFKEALEELSKIVAVECEDGNGLRQKIDMEVDESRLHCRTNAMDIDGHINHNKFSENSVLKNIGEIVRDLRGLGLASIAEDAYGSAIFLLLKDKVHSLAGDDYRTSVLGPVKEWIQAVPLQFFYALLSYLGDPVSHGISSFGTKNSPLATFPSSCYPGINCPSEELIRWQLRLEYFAYETLQDLRIAKLFEIIVDYPDSSPAIEDLKHCLEYTGQHSKLVDSFISALRYRLLTAGASTNDILHQYVSTVKALRTIDPAGVFLEAVGEPIKEYLRGRKDTIKCIVTMLTNRPCGNPDGHGGGDGLLEELIRDDENRGDVDLDDVIIMDEKQAWIDAQRWEPDPVEADPLRGSKAHRKANLLGMIVGIIGSKDQLINEYRVMLAEKLLNKTDYDIDAEIRSLELLKIHFGEGSMQRCEIMLNDLIGSKRMNTNIKQTIHRSLSDLSMDILDATIISSNFWPPIQEESLVLPGPVDHLLSEYAKRFNEIKTPRKLLWKKSLGTVKLELQFEDRTTQFTVTPMHAAIIVLFQSQKSWTFKNLAAAIGVSEDIVNRRISFWVAKGVLSERFAENSKDRMFTVVDDMVDDCKCEGIVDDDDVERSVASGKSQLLVEMSVYENFITGMLTNFGSMMLGQIHNSLKMFCVGDPAYDKSMEELHSFLSGLVSDEKLDVMNGQYFLKK